MLLYKVHETLPPLAEDGRLALRMGRGPVVDDQICGGRMLLLSVSQQDNIMHAPRLPHAEVDEPISSKAAVCALLRPRRLWLDHASPCVLGDPRPSFRRAGGVLKEALDLPSSRPRRSAAKGELRARRGRGEGRGESEGDGGAEGSSERGGQRETVNKGLCLVMAGYGSVAAHCSRLRDGRGRGQVGKGARWMGEGFFVARIVRVGGLP